MVQTNEVLCPGCFADKGQANPCPHCGYDEGIERSPLVLPHRTVLHGQFIVGRVLGKPGGFGITYLGWDLNLHTRVAIKEYLPRDLAGRAVDRATVAAHSGDDGAQFRYGLEQFIREARTLAQLDHPNIVRVRQFFEANGTAYLVMDYYQGFSLAEYLDQQGGRLPEEQAKQLMLPILDGLRAVHAEGFLHRDIKPQNIYLARLKSGGVRPILLDFGTARQALGERSRSLSVVISPGYAPFEQYHRKGKQGPWTDIYGAAAVLYRMVTGETPLEATERMAGDDLPPATVFGVSPRLSEVLGVALAIGPETRPQQVQTFQDLLSGKGQPPYPLGWVSDQAQQLPARDTGADSHPREVIPKEPVAHLGADGIESMGTGLQDRLKDGGLGPELVRLPPGLFYMGSPKEEPYATKAEKPQHQVQIEQPFAIGRFPVTFDDYDRFKRPPDNGWGRGRRPVILVSWEDAIDYCAWLTHQTGQPYRLPTEAEWEYACRAGTMTRWSFGDDKGLGHCAWFAGNSGSAFFGWGRKTQPVGLKRPNPWGLHDMYGNVWEWVQDCWHDSYQGAPTDGSAWSTSCSKSGWRVLRGGSWDNFPWDLRSANRIRTISDSQRIYVGFRIARTLTP